MEFETVYTDRSFRQAQTAGRTWSYWPRTILGNFRGLVFGFCILFLGCRFLAEGLTSSPIDLKSVGIGLLILGGTAGVVFWAYYNERKEQSKALVIQSAVLYRLEAIGFSMTDMKTGASSTTPWALYSYFSTKEHIIILKLASSKGFYIIPTDSLTPMQSGQLRSILLSHLSEQ